MAKLIVEFESDDSIDAATLRETVREALLTPHSVSLEGIAYTLFSEEEN